MFQKAAEQTLLLTTILSVKAPVPFPLALYQQVVPATLFPNGLGRGSQLQKCLCAQLGRSYDEKSSPSPSSSVSERLRMACEGKQMPSSCPQGHKQQQPPSPHQLLLVPRRIHILLHKDSFTRTHQAASQWLTEMENRFQISLCWELSIFLRNNEL